MFGSMGNDLMFVLGVMTGAIEIVDENCVIFRDARRNVSNYKRIIPMRGGLYEITVCLN